MALVGTRRQLRQVAVSRRGDRFDRTARAIRRFLLAETVAKIIGTLMQWEPRSTKMSGTRSRAATSRLDPRSAASG